MIYASSSIVINTSGIQLWQALESFLKDQVQGEYITGCTVLESYYDGFMRSLSIADKPLIKERVFLVKEQNKIVARLEDNPLLIGDTIFQIISPDNAELSQKRVTLCVVIAWRMRPGIIEAPRIDKQRVVDDLATTIKAIIEQKMLV